ncbi:MAG: histidine phosphatase family protein [Promethearchaeota archaeon]
MFLRHMHTIADYTKPASEWRLSPEGIDQSRKLIFHPAITRESKVDHIFCSSEPKTVQSITPFLDHWHYRHVEDAHFDEVRSTSLPTINRQQYLIDKAFAFNNHASSSETQESFEGALERFDQGIENATLIHPTGTILIVSHGTILTLYFGQLRRELKNGEKMFRQWKNLRFGAIGIVENGKIIKNLHEGDN